MTHSPTIRSLVIGVLAAPLVLTTVTAVSAASPSERVAVRELHATLSASGDTDGSGHADFRLNKARHRVCATVTWQNIAQPDSAHIHKKSDGSIVVDLSTAVTGGAHCTTGVSGPLIGRILAHPRRYYFNVHNPDHPSGAIQGPLRH